jgi:hypothetical protein
MNISQLDLQSPGKVYLCQVNDQVSCGACCGLYNVADASRDNLERLLTFRTETFAAVPRTIDDIMAFKRMIEAREPQTRPFPEFHHCPFIGLIGDNHSRVGCLLHPLADGNQGIDWRGLSYYGGMACRSYFCPTYRGLKPAFKSIVRELCDDWYLFGLIITETELLNAFFGEIERRSNHPLTPETILNHPHRRQAVSAFLQLKIDWPFRTAQTCHPCHYFFEDQQYRRAPIAYDHLGCPPSRHDVILHELDSQFESIGALRQAEKMLDGILDAVITRSAA